MSEPLPFASDEYERQFRELLKEAADTPEGRQRNAILHRALELARREHYDAAPAPTSPDPLADLRRDCVAHLRMCDVLELGEVLNPIALLSGYTRRITARMRHLYNSGTVLRKPPYTPDFIPNARTGNSGWLVEPAREVVRTVLAWCDEARPASAPPHCPAGDGTRDSPEQPRELPPPERDSAVPRCTLGQLIVFLDGLERNRQSQRLQHQEHLRRDPLNAALNAVYSAALRWQPDEREMPGIRRIELLCDLEPGEAGINAAKVRRLRAHICQRQHWRPQHADQLTLGEAADLLEGVQRVTLGELERAQSDLLHHGLATLDTISIGGGEVVQVTGLSCKVVAGTTPTACPDANPVLPPSLLPVAERAIRRLNPLPEGTTIHWVGHDTGVRNRCRCHPNAPFAAPFDQSRWAGVIPSPASQLSSMDTNAPSPPGPPPPPSQSFPPAEGAIAAPAFTVGDIRALLAYRANLAAYRAGLRRLDPARVLGASLFPSLNPMEYAEVVRALTPPEPPRLTDDVAWTLATYRRLAASARQAQRDTPDEGDLMALVGSVAGMTSLTVEELLRMPESDFEQLVLARSATPLADSGAQSPGANRRHEPAAGDGERGGGNAVGEPIADRGEIGAARRGAPPAADPALDDAELSVLQVLMDRRPLLVKNVDIEVAADLSKQKAGEVISELIAKNLAARPKGERKGATLTPEGIALVDRIRKSSADHP